MKILVVDDEPAIVAALRPTLTSFGHSVSEAGDARRALAIVNSQEFDLLLLDLGLPDAEGIEIIGKVRECSDAAIIILSARHLEQDKVRALDEGADDYINKPFGLDELLARIRVVARRRSKTEAAAATRLESEVLTIDVATRQVILLGQTIHLSPKEFALLEVLARNSGQVVTQRRLMIAGWNDPTIDSQYLRGYIALLRQKLEADPSDPELLLTEPGVGYRLALNMQPSYPNE